jgi:hypothetical protein
MFLKKKAPISGATDTYQYRAFSWWKCNGIPVDIVMMDEQHQINLIHDDDVTKLNPFFHGQFSPLLRYRRKEGKPMSGGTHRYEMLSGEVLVFEPGEHMLQCVVDAKDTK